MLFRSLTSITIPISVTSIGEYAFVSCSSLSSVTIPESVTLIGGRAFYECYSLTSVLFKGNAPSLDVSDVFDHTSAWIYYLPACASTWPATLAGHPTRLWNPTVQSDAAFGFSADRFGFNIAGTSYIPVKVEATTNLSSGVWTPITNATLDAAGSLTVTDPDSDSHSARFYRIVFPY